MSLSVDVFVVDANGEMHVLDVPEGCSDLAGPEQWRTTVWGSAAVRSLETRLFPMLTYTDLQVDPGHVPHLTRECALIRRSLQQIADSAAPTQGAERLQRHISERLLNIEAATRRAEKAGGGVLLW